ncbi:carboxylesterase/lipase family protein [Stakelama saccharophila]|uniref:Carboxylic ester hydrolase n=1 Tax=Stakelama saccharophila TaxID=3075605 RepID=A0ABZ0B8Q2_9SPHN|nr:carboxylesterase family protein [Stakelama sp. W311]WNO52689.1 carboxylesterase family protein [Stakelama sp. W311]
MRSYGVTKLGRAAGGLAVALALTATHPVSFAAEAPVVEAPAGTVQGIESGDLRIFKGLPYALPPIGDARWRPPRPMPAWGGVRDAASFGPACFQPGSAGKSIYHDELPAMSEDCLTLNIWTPKDAEHAPVFVWIHGGALTNGASSEAMYDGAKLAEEGMVVVSINYRLGVLGYLAHPALSAESPRHVSGNYGLLDQIAALKWVKANIAAFGGNADNVTIAGESAGALSVMYLMASPLARGLFDKAIAESAYMVSTPELRGKRFGMESAEASGAALMNKLGAGNSLAAMRKMDAATLVKQAPATGYLPWGTIDGYVLTRQLVDTFDRGEQAPVPLIAGFNSGEIRSLRILLPPRPDSAEAYRKRIRAGYGELADTFLKFYPADDVDESMLAATRDAMYGWTAERLVRKQTAIGAPSYLYLFDHGYPAADEMGLHGFHASELPYVFGTADRTPPLWPKVPDDPVERNLSEAMRDYWSSFARSGDPSAAGQPNWPSFGHDEAYMYFAQAPQAATRPLPGRYRLHEEVMCRRHAAGDIAWNWNVGIASPPLPPEAPECQ